MSIISTRMGSAAPSAVRPSESETSSDEMLIRRIAGGDQLAMRTLFCRHRVALYRWLLRLVRDEALAEDLLSDVFLDVWRQAASFEGRSSVSTWLLAIARYKALSARRRRRDVELDETIASTVADPADDPEVVLQKKDAPNACAIPWSGCPPSTARSSTWSTITANRSRTPLRSSALARPQRRPGCFTHAGNWPTWSRRPSASPAKTAPRQMSLARSPALDRGNFASSGMARSDRRSANTQIRQGPSFGSARVGIPWRVDASSAGQALQRSHRFSAIFADRLAQGACTEFDAC